MRFLFFIKSVTFFLLVILASYSLISPQSAYAAVVISNTPNSSQSLQPGGQVGVTIQGIPSSGTHTYRFSIKDAQNQSEWDGFNIRTSNGLCSDPENINTSSGALFSPALADGGELLWARGQQLPSTCTYQFTIQTPTTYNCNPGSISTLCRISLSENGTSLSQSSFSLTKDTSASQLTLTLTSSEQRSKNIFYEDTKVTISASGCPANSTIDFRWWRSPDDANFNSCIENTANISCDGNGDGKSFSSTDGSATFCKGGDGCDASFGSNEGSANGEKYVIRAFCPGAKAIQEFSVLSTDSTNDGSIFVGEPILPNTAFSVVLDQLKSDNCYYYKLRREDGDMFQPSESGGIIDCGGDSETVNELNDFFSGKDDVYKASSHWGRSANSAVTSTYDTDENKAYASGLPAGKYTAELHHANWSGAEVLTKKIHEYAFCVGDDLTCGGDLPPTEPPPSPCIRGTDGSGQDIDLKGDFQTLEDMKTELRKLPRQTPEDAAVYKQQEDAYKEFLNTITEKQKLIEKCSEVRTAFGAFGVNPTDFVQRLMAILLSISGGIVLILIIISGYQLMFSQGDPEKVKLARERITSAVIGLLFLIFSLVILEVIGVDILHIPGFGS